VVLLLCGSSRHLHVWCWRSGACGGKLVGVSGELAHSSGGGKTPDVDCKLSFVQVYPLRFCRGTRNAHNCDRLQAVAA